MLDYVIIALLVLNTIIVGLMLAKRTNNRDKHELEEFQQKILGQQNQLYQECTELKKSVAYLHAKILQQLEHLVLDRQALEQVIQHAAHSEKAQHLLLNDRFKEIFDLQRQGYSAEHIAKELDKGIGEVSFILQLSEQSDSKERGQS